MPEAPSDMNETIPNYHFPKSLSPFTKAKYPVQPNKKVNKTSFKHSLKDK